MSRYWYAEVRQSAGSAGVVSIYSHVNDHSRAIKVLSCTAKSSGAVAAVGVSLHRDRAGKSIPVYLNTETLTANETTTAPMPFLLLPGERIKATFSSTAAATDVLEFVAFGEYVEVLT
jgi:hypothetical protein